MSSSDSSPTQQSAVSTSGEERYTVGPRDLPMEPTKNLIGELCRRSRLGIVLIENPGQNKTEVPYVWVSWGSEAVLRKICRDFIEKRMKFPSDDETPHIWTPKDGGLIVPK